MCELPENTRRQNCAGHGEEASERQWKVAGMLSEPVSEVNQDFANHFGWKRLPLAQAQRGLATLAVYGERRMIFRPESRSSWALSMTTRLVSAVSVVPVFPCGSVIGQVLAGDVPQRVVDPSVCLRVQRRVICVVE